jgi:hypothetical protein
MKKRQYILLVWLVAAAMLAGNLTVLAATDADAVAGAKNSLTWNAVRGTNSASTAQLPGPYTVTGNLVNPLPRTGANGTTITWTAINNSPQIINLTTGAVATPMTETTVILTATVTRGSASDAVTFVLTVKPDTTQDQADIDKVKAWLTGSGWEHIRGGNPPQTAANPGEARYDVSADLNLFSNGNASGTSGVTIIWSANSTAVNAGDGTVTPPASGGAQVTLTATLIKGTVTDMNIAGNKVPFHLSVLSDRTVTGVLADWLTWENIRGRNARQGDVVNTGSNRFDVLADLNLNPAIPRHITAGGTSIATAGMTVTWAVSGGTASIDTDTGAVAPPATGSEETTLTAVIRRGGTESAKGFYLSVRRPTDAESVAMALEALTWESIRGRNTRHDAVKQDLFLPAECDFGTSVTWSSSNTGALSNTGAVTLPAPGCSVQVTLTATVRKGSATGAKPFVLHIGDPQFTVEDTPGGSTAQIPADDFGTLSAGGTREVLLETALCDIVFDAAAAAEILRQAQGDEITVFVEKLDDAGGRPAYAIRIMTGNRELTGFTRGTVTAAIPYTLKADEDRNAIFASLLDSEGGPHSLRSYYDSGRVLMITGKLSGFAVSYDPVGFKDVPFPWGTEHITFVTARRLFNGHADGTFGPGGYMTRAQFTAALRNYDGADLSGYTSSNFADAQDGWYAGIIAWGVDAGLYGSTSSGNFFPDTSITRADMAYWLYNYAVNSGVRLDPVRSLAFSDIDGLSADVRTAVTALADAGVISGSLSGDERLFRPQASSTRTEVAAMIAQFVKAFSL